MRSNAAALIVLLLIVVGLPALLFGYQGTRSQAGGIRVIEVTARIPENGGFSPDHLELNAGETVRLRISSPDTVHGLSIPELDVRVEEIVPGKPVEVDVTPAKSGRFAFACIRWCGVDHWRMRGVVVVSGEGLAAEATPEPPLYQRLGLDLDAMRMATTVVPRAARQPSAAAGAAYRAALPDSLSEPERRRQVTPADAFLELRGDKANSALTDEQVWDLVAYAWMKDVGSEALAGAKEWFAQDCAACHGQGGKGDGPAGRDLPGMNKMDPDSPRGPADFTNTGRMMAVKDVVLQGKILRGGMGTGMPEFGSLYTDEQLWALVAYVRGFTLGAAAR